METRLFLDFQSGQGKSLHNEQSWGQSSAFPPLELHPTLINSCWGQRTFRLFSSDSSSGGPELLLFLELLSSRKGADTTILMGLIAMEVRVKRKKYEVENTVRFR
jgi:hypothetical protein